VIAGPSIPGVFVVQGAPLKKLVAPSLVGTGKVGTKLVLSPGVWTPALTSKSMVWKRDGKAVKGQTGTAYTVRSTDKGHKISVTVTAKRAGFANGVATSAPVTGTLSAKVKHRALPGALTTPTPMAVSVTGGLTVPVGTAVGCRSAHLVGQLPTMTAATVLADARIGRRLTCSTTVSVPLGTATFEVAFHAGPGAALAPYVKPFVAGVAKVGKKLSVGTGKWLPAYTRVTFQWLKDGKAIKGATQSTFVVPAADRHHKLSVRLTGTRAGWLGGSATTAPVRVG
jgi:hypothetical protein